MGVCAQGSLKDSLKSPLSGLGIFANHHIACTAGMKLCLVGGLAGSTPAGFKLIRRVPTKARCLWKGRPGVMRLGATCFGRTWFVLYSLCLVNPHVSSMECY